MTSIVRRVWLALPALAALCVCSTGSAVSRVNGLTINVTYSASSLQAKLSNGAVLGNGAVVPPGLYSIVVYDDGADANPAFELNGPGASETSDLNPNGNGIEVPVTLGPYTFAPSSTYVIADANLAGSSITFTTAATGSSASADTTTTTATSKGASTASAAEAKTLSLFVTPTGTPTLTVGGKPVKTLEAGTYSLLAADTSTKEGLIIGHGKARPTTLSGAAAIGTSSHVLHLTAGKWFFEGSTKGPKKYFTVK